MGKKSSVFVRVGPDSQHFSVAAMKTVLRFWIVVLQYSLGRTVCPSGLREQIHDVCSDIDECVEDPTVCGEHSICFNTFGAFICTCKPGFHLIPVDFSGATTKCVELNCDIHNTTASNVQTLPKAFGKILSLVKDSCLSNPWTLRRRLTGEQHLKELVNITDVFQLGLKRTTERSNYKEVTAILNVVENIVSLVASQLQDNVTHVQTDYTELEIMVTRGKDPPRGQVHLTNQNSLLDITWDTVIGHDKNYTGFGSVFILSYKSLETSTDSYQQLISTVTTVSVTNGNTTRLPQAVNITFRHLQSDIVGPTCVYWSTDGAEYWSRQGCISLFSNSTHTMCSCNHLSSFALIAELHPQKESDQPSVLWFVVALCMGLVCVAFSLFASLVCRYVSRRGNRLQNVQRSMST